MNDLTAAEGLRQLERANELLAIRHVCAEMYRDAIAGCEWLTPQYVPPGWHHDWWAWAVATDTPGRALRLADAVVAHGGERPFFAWRITYQEPALRHLAPDGTCPIAESLQPRLLQVQTTNLASAERNARALCLAIKDVGR
jgi:dTDP-4-amino-4,6-dideoxygalactose transaminase